MQHCQITFFMKLSQTQIVITQQINYILQSAVSKSD
jgi:hypothetical protein